jgi:LPPG:FO 2-phospho-L-lactate transferase
MEVVALAGGVGGAKMASGLYQVLPPENLTIVVNVGDDFEHLGLKICPDLDTVCYTLAGIANPGTGWGRDEETWNAFESMSQLGGPDWFRLGDRDLGTHLARSHLLARGFKLDQVIEEFCHAWGVSAKILPVSNDAVPTLVLTDEGQLSFQEYFVHRQCQPRVRGFEFEGIAKALPVPAVLQALENAQLIIICPSNPWVSIDPILKVPGVMESLMVHHEADRRAVIAISPIIAGKALKGPAAKMYMELGITPSALAVAQHYCKVDQKGFLTGFVFDKVDSNYQEAIDALSIKIFLTDTVMNTPNDRKRLAEEVIAFGINLIEG